MKPDVKCTSRAIEIGSLSGGRDGHPSSSSNDVVARPSMDDDLRWFSANDDDDRTSVGDEAEAVSTNDDDDDDDDDDVCTLTADDDDEDMAKDKRGGGASSDHVDGDASAEDGNECRSTNEDNECCSTKDESECRSIDEDLEGQEQSREPPDGGARAWLVASGAFAALVCTFGYLNTFGVFQSYYQRHLLADRWPSEIAWIGSTQVFLLFLGGLLSGPLADRYGFRAVFCPSAVLLVAAVMLSSICDTYATLLLTHGVLFGFASGMIFTPTVSVVGQYFTCQRALATGIAVSGASVGGVVFPLVLDRLLNASTLGFGVSVRILGAGMAILLIFTAAVTCEFAPRRKRRLFLPQPFYESAYLLTLFGFFFTLLGFWTPIFFLVEYAQSQGIDAASAFHLVAIMNATSFVGRIFLSFVADRVGRFNANAALTACTAVLIFAWTTAETQTAITVWVSFYGFFQGAVMLLISPCLAQICPRPSDIGTYVGMALACGSVGGLLDTPINGALISQLGYLHASIFSGCFVLVGAICYAMARLRIDGRLLAKV